VRKVSTVQIVVLLLCLILTGLLVYMRPMGNIEEKSLALETEVLKLRDRYKITNNRLSPRVIEELKLDDYIFQTYTRNGGAVTLYVGYYFSGKKVGAAHDPQVCYPGQGWKLSNKEKGTYELKNGEKVDYSSIIAAQGGSKDLIFYWFQVNDKTADNTLFQKMILLQNKILQQGENNAFVRVSTSLNEESIHLAQKRILDFMEDFYPIFLEYIEST
jgi:EpsI family protein